MSQTDPKEPLRIKSSTPVQELATSIVAAHAASPDNVVLRCVGPMSLNQAVKGIIVSNKTFIKKGIVATIMPSFCDIVFEDKSEPVSGISLKIIFKTI